MGVTTRGRDVRGLAPRLTGRPRVEDQVACGAHQIHTQVTCTREVGGRESGRGRERERACVPVPLSCGGRACTILLQEGGGAQSCSQRRHVIEYGPITTHTGCTIAGLPRFLTALRRTLPGKHMVGVRFPGLVRIALYTAGLFCKASSVWQTSNCRVNCCLSAGASDATLDLKPPPTPRTSCRAS